MPGSGFYKCGIKSNLKNTGRFAVMKKLWNMTERMSLTADRKLLMFRLICEAISASAGVLVWLILRIWILDSWQWLLCFAGYPAVIARFSASVYCLNHEFGRQ